MTPAAIRERADLRLAAIAILRRAGLMASDPQARRWTTSEPGRGIANLPGLLHPDASDEDIATGLMELYRRDRCPAAFEHLVEWTRPQLLRRARYRCRMLGPIADAEEVVQDVFVNIFRYPDRFDARRPNAFHAWAIRIVDNATRRSVRSRRHGLDVAVRSSELLAEAAEPGSRGPSELLMRREEFLAASTTLGLVLQFYLHAFQRLSVRERHVLHRVEVDGLRYAELGPELGMRPDALKMVVFRARRRIFTLMQSWMDGRAVIAA